MANGGKMNFEGWLCSKLTSLGIDAEVYTSYITGILDENDEESEKKEALNEVLGSMLEEDVCDKLSDELIDNWAKTQDNKGGELKTADKQGIDDILAAHVEASQQQFRVKETKPSTQSNAVKQSVIAMYSSVDDEAAESTTHAATQKESKVKSVDDALEVFKNTNAASVSQAEKHERIKQKDLAEKKKEKDKHDRELQKIKKNERKDKEKKRTQKKERMR